MRKWSVPLKGATRDLGYLVGLFGQEESVSVQPSDGEYVLLSDEFERLTDAGIIWNRAAEIVGAMCGLASASKSTFQQVAVGSAVLERTPDGIRKHGFGGSHAVVWITASEAGSGDGTRSIQGQPRYADLLQEADRDEEKRSVLTEWGKARDWPELYVVYEMVKRRVGPPEKWRRFTQTAQMYRHAQGEKHEPPAHPMSLAEARSFIAGFVNSWIRGGMK